MKKVAITQDLCRMVELMLKGGAQQKEVGERLGISKATVSRIKTAGYDPEQYRKNTEKRVAEENRAEEEAKAEEQTPGQIRMDLIPDDQLPEPLPRMTEEDLQVKLMRFQAGQVEKLLTKLDRISDQLGQILRKMDG